MFKATVSVKNIEGFNSQFDEVFLAIEANLREVAGYVKSEADTTAEFADKTGTLRKGNKLRKSRYLEGGYIVFNKEPHAHLVEYGHVQLTSKGEATKAPGRVAAHPFMRKALEKGITMAIAELPKKSE
jgi:hypothetical protein